MPRVTDWQLAEIRRFHYVALENLPLAKALGFCEAGNQNLIRQALGIPPWDGWPQATFWQHPRREGWPEVTDREWQYLKDLGNPNPITVGRIVNMERG